MRGSVITRITHRCGDGKNVRHQWTTPPDNPRCERCGADLRKADKQYVAVYRASGRQRWKTFARKHDAERHLTNGAKAVQDGTYVAVQPAPIATVIDEWIKLVLDVEESTGDLKPSYVKSCRSIIRKHLRPAFADVRSDQLLDAVPHWLKSLATKQADGKLTRKSVKNIVGLLGTILEWAREPSQRYLANDPLAAYRRRARKRKGGTAPAREVRHLETSELHALLDAADDNPVAEMILYLAAYSGLRRGELFALQWGDLDEDAAQLRVRRSIYQGAITRPKTETSARRVDLPAPIVARFKAYREQYPPIEKGFIFRTDGGSPLDPDNWFRRVFVPLAIKAKLRPTDISDVDDADLVGLHTLRHTYASMLIAAGENVKYVSRQLGHANIQITLNTYSHLLKETSTSAMARLAMRIPSAKPANVVSLATGTNG